MLGHQMAGFSSDTGLEGLDETVETTVEHWVLGRMVLQLFMYL